MDQTLLVRMLRLRTVAARKGVPFDIERFAADRPYAKATLKSLLQIEDDELETACRQTMDSLGLTTPARSGSSAPQTQAGALDSRPCEPDGVPAPARDPKGELVDSEWP